MFKTDVTSALAVLNHEVCKCYNSGSTFKMEEKREAGKATIEITTSCPCIHVRDMDDRKFKLLVLQKCADHIVFKYDSENDSWDLHVFELKKTISRSKWNNEITKQFEGALMNAYAISGILHIANQDIRNIYVHCGYRRNTTAESLIENKLLVGESARDVNWLNESLVFDYLPERTIGNVAIQLDKENGHGSFSLP